MFRCAAKLRGVIFKPGPSQSFFRSLVTSLSKNGFVSEPDYLKYLKPAVPVYEKLNIQMKCYDFTVLEHYAKHVHRTALNMDIEVEKAWATPHQAWKVTNIEPSNKKVINEYQLNTYERNVQVTNLPAYSAALFFEVIQSALPEGVSVSVHPHLPEHESTRYIPDFDLIDLNTKLEELSAEHDLPKK